MTPQRPLSEPSSARRHPPPNALLSCLALAFLVNAGCSDGGSRLSGPNEGLDVRDVMVEPANDTIPVGASVRFRISVLTMEGDTIRQEELEDLHWTSYDESVATVDSTGLATGLSVGTSTIQPYFRALLEPWDRERLGTATGTYHTHASLKVVDLSGSP